MQAVQKELGSDPRVQIVSVCTYADRDAVAKFVEENKVAWMQVLLDFEASDVLRDDWGYKYSNGPWLIGPDGTIRAIGLTGEGILWTVKSELREPAAPQNRSGK